MRVRVCAWCVRCVALISGCGLAFCCVILKIDLSGFCNRRPQSKGHPTGIDLLYNDGSIDLHVL